MLTTKLKAALAIGVAVAALAPAAIAAACGDEQDSPQETSNPVPGGFYSIPQVGSEPVRGSGCGADGSLRDLDHLPDGTWLGYVRAVHPVTQTDLWLDFDVACVYYGESARQVVRQGDQHIVHNDPDFLVVSNNRRTRTVVGDATSFSWTGYWDEHGNCQEGGTPGFPADRLDDRLALLSVWDGNLVAVNFGCV